MHPEKLSQLQEKLKANRLLRMWWSFCGIYSVVVIFALGLYMTLTGELPAVLVALVAFALARFIISPLIFFLYKKPRPYQTAGFEPITSKLLSFGGSKQNAFPSDHALSFASIAAVLYYYHPAFGIVVGILAVCNGLGRIRLGYHDWWDVVGGWAVGLLSAFLAIYFFVPWLFTVGA